MSWRKRLGIWMLKALDIDDELLYDAWATVDWSTDSFTSLSKEGYEHCATVFRCVNLIAKTCAGVILGVFDEDAEDGPELIKGHPFTKLIKRPNPLMGRAAMIKYWTMNLLLGGRSFIWANRLGENNSGEVHYLWVLPPNEVDVVEGARFGTIAGFTWTHRGSTIQLPPEDVLYTWFPNPRDLMKPISPLKAAAQEVDLSNQGMKWNLRLLANSPKHPSYVGLEKDAQIGALTDPQVETLKKQLAEEYGGAENVGKVPVFRVPGVKLYQHGWNPLDMDWIKAIENADVRIANVYDVPPELIGAQKTYENFAVAEKVLYTQAVLPVLDLFCDNLTNWDALKLNPNEFIAPLRERIKALQEDQETISKRMEREVNAGIRTRNEARSELRLEPHDDPLADVLTVGKEVTALSELGFNMGTQEVGDAISKV